MQACAIERFGEIGDVGMLDVPKPTCGPDEVLVRVRAAAVNPADLKVLTHRDGGRFLHASKFPLILGFDFAGDIVEVGTNAGAHKVGDAVFGFLPYSSRTRNGTFAEYVAAKANAVGPKPTKLSYEEAAAAATAAVTALQVLRDHGRLASGGTVLVHGASGGVGSYAVQIAKCLGAKRVVGTASAAKQDYVTTFGADRVVDYKATPLAQIGEQFDVIADVSATSSFGECAPLLTAKGTYVTTLPSAALVAGLLRSLFSSKRCRIFVVKNAAADFEQVSRWFDEDKLIPSLDASYPLAEVRTALTRVKDGSVRGKVAITIP